MYSSIVVDGNYVKASEYNNLRLDIAPVGTIILWGKTSAPDHWLLCNGSLYSTSSMPDLFSVIAYSFGGAGATFKVPDLSAGRFPIGKSGTHPICSTSDGQSLAQANIPAHTHTIATTVAHTHRFNVTLNSSPASSYQNFLMKLESSGAGWQTDTADAHDHGGVTGAVGSSTVLSIEPEYLAIYYIIKYQ
jgi:microcystin-dependent protein